MWNNSLWEQENQEKLKGCDAYVGIDRLIIQPKVRCVSHLSKQGLCVPHAVPFTAENG